MDYNRVKKNIFLYITNFKRTKNIPVKVNFDDVHGGEVHEPEAEAGHDPAGDVEDGEGGRVQVQNGESSYQQTKGR